MGDTGQWTHTCLRPSRRTEEDSRSAPSFLLSHAATPLFLSLPLPSFLAATTGGSGAALASSSSDASPSDKVCPPFPFPSFPSVRNRTPKPPNVCYLYSDLTMDFTY